MKRAMPELDSKDDLQKTISSADDLISAGNDLSLSMGWLLPLMLLVFATGFVLYFIQGYNNDTVAGLYAIPDNAAEKNKTNVITAQDKQRKPLSIQLNDSTKITAFSNGIEKQLILYITSKDKTDSISKNRWFDFDNLNFESGSAAITASSMQQVHNIAAILNAYPSVKIKIGGYTDKSGDENQNLSLSKARAEAVVAALKKAGANPLQIIGSEGYGSQFAKAAVNAPDEEKQKDRRISINVRAK